MTWASDVLTPRRSAQFKRDVRKAEKRGKDLSKLRTMLTFLTARKPLPESCKDHPLRGPWSGYRDAHIEPDWLLLYRIVGDELQLARTGSHADLFEE